MSETKTETVTITSTVDPDWIEFCTAGNTDLFRGTYCGPWLFGVAHDDALGWLPAPDALGGGAGRCWPPHERTTTMLTISLPRSITRRPRPHYCAACGLGLTPTQAGRNACPRCVHAPGPRRQGAVALLPALLLTLATARQLREAL